MQHTPNSAAARIAAARRRSHRRTRPGRGILPAVLAVLAAALCFWGGVSLCRAAQDAAGMTGAHPRPAGDLSAPADAPADPILPAPAAPDAPAETPVPAPAETPAPAAALPDVTGDWLSEPDAETYAEVISLRADGSCTMRSTMVPVDGGTDGWRDGSWYTAPVGEGTYAYADGDLVFTLQTGDGEAVYTYALTWLGEDRFRADVTHEGSSYTLLFDRVG